MAVVRRKPLNTIDNNYSSDDQVRTVATMVEMIKTVGMMKTPEK